LGRFRWTVLGSMVLFDGSIAAIQGFFARGRSFFNTTLVAAFTATPETNVPSRPFVHAERVFNLVQRMDAARDKCQLGHQPEKQCAAGFNSV